MPSPQWIQTTNFTEVLFNPGRKCRLKHLLEKLIIKKKKINSFIVRFARYCFLNYFYYILRRHNNIPVEACPNEMCVNNRIFHTIPQFLISKLISADKNYREIFIITHATLFKEKNCVDYGGGFSRRCSIRLR